MRKVKGKFWIINASCRGAAARAKTPLSVFKANSQPSLLAGTNRHHQSRKAELREGKKIRLSATFISVYFLDEDSTEVTHLGFYSVLWSDVPTQFIWLKPCWRKQCNFLLSGYFKNPFLALYKSLTNVVILW